MRSSGLGACLVLALVCACGNAGAGERVFVVRPPAVAGTFYPADSSELAGMVDSLRDLAGGFVPPPGQTIISGLAPHAGYAYSAPTAAALYASLRGLSFDRVYVLAPAHRAALNGMCAYDGDAFLTPLGTVPVDTSACSRLAASCPAVRLGSAEHAAEHAIEVQLPFLQRSLASGWKLVPVLVGWTDGNSLSMLAEMIFADAWNSRVLVIASSDLSHYPPLPLADLSDSLTLSSWASGDPEAFLDATDESSLPPGLETRACGRLPMAVVLYYDRLWGHCSTTVLGRATSAEATGDRSSVVGYGAAVCTVDTSSARSALSPGARSRLCAIVARELRLAAEGEPPSDSLPDLGGELGRYRGVFVTYTEHGALRGCIGTMRPVYPLARAVAMMARSAALEDPRFPAISRSELGSVDMEISVLTPLQLLEDPLSVRLGTDGLLIVKNGRSGVLLPQVPAEAGWTTPEQFLEGLCQKAGLPAGAWRRGATLFRFQAEVFGP